MWYYREFIFSCFGTDDNFIFSVTFSRLEPEGKLVMGFRKASNAPPSDQVLPYTIA